MTRGKLSAGVRHDKATDLHRDSPQNTGTSKDLVGFVATETEQRREARQRS